MGVWEHEGLPELSFVEDYISSQAFCYFYAAITALPSK